jgi:hypothetical protein
MAMGVVIVDTGIMYYRKSVLKHPGVDLRSELLT